MSVVYGHLTTNPSRWQGDVFTRLMRELDSSGAENSIFDKPDLVLKSCAEANYKHEPLVGTTLDNVCVAIVGRPLDHHQALRRIPDVEWDQLARTLRGLDGYWVAFAYDEKSGALEVLCDALGVAWLYWAHVPGGVAFSSHFGALARSLPARPRLNLPSSLLMLTLTYPLDESTCFDEIRVVSPGSVLRFQDGTVIKRALPPRVYGDLWAYASRSSKFEALDAALDASYEAWSPPGAKAEWTVALSGGNDSRYGLGVLLRHGVRPNCATFGLPGSTDVRRAATVCQQERLQHTVFTTKRRTSWDSWGAAIQRLGVVSGIQYVAGWAHEWRRTLHSLNGQVLLGYLGDALSGLHLVDRFGNDWLTNWEAWSFDEGKENTWVGSEMIREEVRRQFRDIARAALEHACAGIEFCFEHQKALHLDLLTRQRRATAAQVNFLADDVPVAPIFYFDQLIAFWSNLSYEDLKGQALYLDYARDRFARLFPSQKQPSLYARARGTVVNFVGEFFPGVKVRFAPPEIDRRALVAQHMDSIRKLIRDQGEAISDLVDLKLLAQRLDRFPTRDGISAPQLIRLANLLLLVETGGSLASTSRSEFASHH